MKKRFLSILLALCMALALLPVGALATDSDFVIEDGVLVEYKGPGGDVVIPSSVTKIGMDAFAGCTGLTSVTIPNSVTSIGDFAFSDCTGLTSVTIPNSVTSIGIFAFSWCTGLTSVTIPNSVTVLGHSAFLDCTSLTSVTIPSSVTGLGDCLFLNCTSLTSVTIPASVKEMGFYVFDVWDGSVYSDSSASETLKDIYYGGTKEQWDAISSFYDNNDSIYDDNKTLKTAIIHYNASPVLFKFPDLKPNGFYMDAVEWALEQGITTGKTAATFAPNENCTHGQILTFLWRAAGSPKSNATLPFGTTGKEYYLGAAKWAYEKGMIDKNFNHKTPCTRADAVSYIWQAFGKQSASYDGRFTDVPANSPHATAVAWALNNGVTTGATAATFTPNKICNRGEIVTFLYRAMG